MCFTSSGNGSPHNPVVFNHSLGLVLSPGHSRLAGSVDALLFKFDCIAVFLLGLEIIVFLDRCAYLLSESLGLGIA